MFQNTPRSPTDLSLAQLVFGRNLTDAIPFSRQMLCPQNRYEKNIDPKSVRINVTRTIRQREGSFPYSDRASESDFKTRSRRSGPSLGRSQVSARQTINIEAVGPRVQPVWAPPPVRREATVDSRSFAEVASQTPQPSTVSNCQILEEAHWQDRGPARGSG
jgi:hypothetical protein